MKTIRAYKTVISFGCAVIFGGMWMLSYPMPPGSWGTYPTALTIFFLAYGVLGVIGRER